MPKSLEALESLFVEGEAPFTVGNDTYQTYYRIAGDLKSSQTPVVILHGGPGLTSRYLITHADLVENNNIPIILFDQLGGGKSTYLPQKGADFWTVDLFCDQLEQLLDFLKISERYHLLGHSWGGMLAMYFAANRKYRGLDRIVIVGSPASAALCDVSARLLIAKFPEKVQEAVYKQEARVEFNKEDTEEAGKLWLKRHLCQLDPVPECVTRELKDVEGDRPVNHCMMGNLPFKTLGTMEKFSLIPDLHKIDAFTLLINGEDDMCQDVCVKPIFDHIRKVKWVHYMECSHMPFFEVRERYMQLVAKFLSGVA